MSLGDDDITSDGFMVTEIPKRERAKTYLAFRYTPSLNPVLHVLSANLFEVFQECSQVVA